MGEFSFIDNTGWLKPFIIELHKYYNCSRASTLSEEKITTIFEASNPSRISDNEDANLTAAAKIFTNTTLTFDDANEFAIHNLDSIFKNDCFTLFYENYTWIDCLDYYNNNNNNNNYQYDTKCRISQGFGNRCVPIKKKFNPVFYNVKYNDAVKLAEHSYNYLTHRIKIETILKTPSSDYTRFSINTDENVFNRLFMVNLRHIQKAEKNKGPFDHILSTYNSKVEIMK